MAFRDDDSSAASERFARTFAPDRDRKVPRSDWAWLGVGPVLVLAGATIAAVGALGGTGRLERNAFVGIRTAATLRSPAAWEAAHRAAAMPLLLAAIPPVVIGARVLVTRPDDRTVRRWSLVGVGAFAVLVLVATLVGQAAAG